LIFALSYSTSLYETSDIRGEHFEQQEPSAADSTLTGMESETPNIVNPKWNTSDSGKKEHFGHQEFGAAGNPLTGMESETPGIANPKWNTSDSGNHCRILKKCKYNLQHIYKLLLLLSIS